MPQQLLDGPDVSAVSQQFRGKRVPKGVASGVFVDFKLADGMTDGVLNDGGIQVMTAISAAARIPGRAWRGKDVLPAPFELSVRILARQSERQLDAAIPRLHGSLALLPDLLNVLLERINKSLSNSS